MKASPSLSSITCVLLFVAGAVAAAFWAGLRAHGPGTGRPVHADGTYRGSCIDGDRIEISLQITLRDGIVTAAQFRHLAYGEFRLETGQEPHRSVVAQYQEALDHLVGKPPMDALEDLYEPGSIVSGRVDGFTAATIRANKIISAVRDALNRGVYAKP